MEMTKKILSIVLATLIFITAFPISTLAATHCTNNNNHAVRCGNTGKWFKDFDEAEAYCISVQKSWKDKYEKGEISENEYKQKCPTGYSAVGCHYCGKCTSDFYYEAMWIKSGSRWWYRYKDGLYTKNDWAKINGKWYYFDNSGWMLTGWQNIDNKRYYLSSSGAMVTGWQEINGIWYFFESSGAMSRNRKIGNYYVDGNGKRVDKIKYEPSWIKTGNRWWFRHADGSYTKNNWEYINGWYHFDNKGWMQTGWLKIGSRWYYLASNGAMKTGWQKIGGAYYYFDDSGVMKSNCWIDEYYVNSSGKWTTSNDHYVPCGNSHKWFNNKYDAETYVHEVSAKWNHKKETGEITWDEYIKNCPGGYECWSCGHCGKWTLNFKYD